MKIYEIGTGYTSIPARIGAATEIVVEELAKSFGQMGHETVVMDIKSENRPAHQLPIREVWVPKMFSGTDVQLGILHKLKRVVYSVFLSQKLKKELKSSSEKVVLHFHNQYNLFFFLKLVPKKYRDRALIAYTNHSGIWSLPWAQVKDTIHKRYFQEAECMKKADAIFVLNPATRENAIHHLGVKPEKIHLIRNGVNTSIYRPLEEEEKNAAAKQFGLEGRKVLLQIGSVYENKGQERVVRLLEPLLKKNPELVYVYAGGIVSEEYQQKVLETARELGVDKQVVYAGAMKPGEEVNRLYNLACVSITASQFEAFPLVTVESLAAGVPVLINATVPMDDGNGCIYYTDECMAELIETKILLDPQPEKLRQEARASAISQYGWLKAAELYDSAFHSKANKE